MQTIQEYLLPLLKSPWKFSRIQAQGLALLKHSKTHKAASRLLVILFLVSFARTMTSRQLSRSSRSRRSKQPEPRKDHELRILLLKGVSYPQNIALKSFLNDTQVPRSYQWQDVKDEVKRYAPRLTVNDLDDGVSRLWSIDIRDSQMALDAYSGLTLGLLGCSWFC